MRWPPFLLSLINLAFAIYILILNVFLTKEIRPSNFLWILVYLALSISLVHLYILYMSNKLDDWYDVDSIKSITNLSILSSVSCTAALLAHLGLEYYNTKTITLYYDSTEMLKSTRVPLVAALLCSMILFSSSIKFKKHVILCKSIDLQPVQRNYHTAD